MSKKKKSKRGGHSNGGRKSIPEEKKAKTVPVTFTLYPEQLKSAGGPLKFRVKIRELTANYLKLLREN